MKNSNKSDKGNIEDKTQKKNVEEINSGTSLKEKGNDNLNTKKKTLTPKDLPSYTFLSIIVLLAYLLFKPLGLILNIIFYRNASKLLKETGVEPRGFGCLEMMLVLAIAFIIIAVLLFMIVFLAKIFT